MNMCDLGSAHRLGVVVNNCELCLEIIGIVKTLSGGWRVHRTN